MLWQTLMTKTRGLEQQLSQQAAASTGTAALEANNQALKEEVERLLQFEQQNAELEAFCAVMKERLAAAEAEAEKAAQQPSTPAADASQMEGLQAKNKELKDKLEEAKGYNNCYVNTDN